MAYRLAHGIGTELDAARYRGLLPHQLIYSGRGAALSQNTKRRTLESGEQRDYKACDSLQSHVTTLYKRAGIKGSSHSGRRGFAGKVLAATGDMDTVAVLLGIAQSTVHSATWTLTRPLWRRCLPMPFPIYCIDR